MRSRFVTLPFVLLAATLQWCSAVERTFKDAHVRIDFTPPNRLNRIGGPIVLRCTVQQLEEEVHGYLNSFNLPTSLWLQVRDSEGRQVDSRAEYVDSAEPMGEKTIVWRNGEVMEFACALNDAFKLTSSGKYTLEAYWGRKIAYRCEFEIVDLEQTAQRKVNEAGSPPLTYPDFRSGTVRLQAKLGSSHCSAEETYFTVLTLDEFLINKQPFVKLQLDHWEQGQVTIKDAQLDYLWQLWIHLERGKESSILVWNLRRGSKHMFASWSEKPKELRSTWASKEYQNALAVIALVDGELGVSSMALDDHFEKNVNK